MRKSLLTAAAVAILTAVAGARCGDCNGDTNTNILDALQAAQHGAGLITLTGMRFNSCDVTGAICPPEGSVNVLDGLKIAQYSAGLPVILKCGEPVWNMACGTADNGVNCLTVGPAISPPSLSTLGSTAFYSVDSVPPNALSMEITVFFQGPTDYDLLVGGLATAPGNTNPANYPLQSRFSNPERVMIDANSTPSIMDYAGVGGPLAIAVHCFNNPGQPYSLSVVCTLPIPPSVQAITLGSSVLKTTTASSGPANNPDMLITGSTHWFVLNTFPTSMQHLDIVVNNLSGNHDIYIGAPTTMAAAPYTLPNYPRKATTTMMVESISSNAMQLAPYSGGPLVIAVTAVTPGNFTIDVNGYSDLTCGSFITDSVATGTSPSRARLNNAAATRLYKLDGVPLNTTSLTIEMIGTSPMGDLDLYVGTTMWGDVTPSNYQFNMQTAGTSNETLVIDAMSTPDIFAFLGSPIAVAVSAFQPGNFSLEVTCVSMGGGGNCRTLTCGTTTMGMVSSPSGMGAPPPLFQPGTTDFYDLTPIPLGTAFVTFRVSGAVGSQYMILVGDASIACGNTNEMQYVGRTMPAQNPEIEVSVCTNPPLQQYQIGGHIPIAVHWVSGGTAAYTIDVLCDPIPMFCAPTLNCQPPNNTVMSSLPVPTLMFPNVNFTPGQDTHFYMLFPIPLGTGSVTIELGSPFDNDADYDLFVGGAMTQPCALSSAAYPFRSQQSAPLLDTVVLNSFDLQAFGCQPVPIAVYYYADMNSQGGYSLVITCN